MKEVKMRGFRVQTRVDKALRIYLKELEIRILQHEDVQITEALGRILSKDVKAEIDVPNFDRSAVDGYALKANDTFGASIISPIIIDVIGVAEIGQVSTISIGKLQAVRIATGAPLPI